MEEHSVVTEDDFVLGVQRIPYGRAERSRRDPKHVVFLQHGLLADSSNWVQNYPDDSLGYILADNGCDVWLGNVRGNRYSRHNCHLAPCEPKFWDWRFVCALLYSTGTRYLKTRKEVVSSLPIKLKE